MLCKRSMQLARHSVETSACCWLATSSTLVSITTFSMRKALVILLTLTLHRGHGTGCNISHLYTKQILWPIGYFTVGIDRQAINLCLSAITAAKIHSHILM